MYVLHQRTAVSAHLTQNHQPRIRQDKGPRRVWGCYKATRQDGGTNAETEDVNDDCGRFPLPQFPVLGLAAPQRNEADPPTQNNKSDSAESTAVSANSCASRHGKTTVTEQTSVTYHHVRKGTEKQNRTRHAFTQTRRQPMHAIMVK